jgi:hypothetical protein
VHALTSPFVTRYNTIRINMKLISISVLLVALATVVALPGSELQPKTMTATG